MTGKHILVLDNTKVSEQRGIELITGGGITLTATETEGDHVLPQIQFDVDGSDLVISRGGTLYNSAGLSAGDNIVVWRLPFSATVSKVYGLRNGGTGATINAGDGTLDFLASDLSLDSADTWMDGGAVQNTSLAAGDLLEMKVVTVAGSPVYISVQVDLVRGP